MKVTELHFSSHADLDHLPLRNRVHGVHGTKPQEMFMTKSHMLEIRKTARILDQATGNYLERIEFRTSSGKMAILELAPSTVSDPRSFAKHLRDAGAILPTGGTLLKPLLEAVAGTLCSVELVYAAQGGWTKNGKAFVRFDKAIGQPLANIVGFRRPRTNDLRTVVKRYGSVESWKSAVAAPAQSSSILMFSISAAFAAPILKVLGMNTFGFCMFGESRSGKTLATVAAGSVIGKGTVAHLLDWNATDNRLQEQLPELNDCIAPIDDLMSMKGTDREKYSRVKSLAYIFALGAGTGRHSSYSAASAENWRTIVLSSNELSLRDLAARSRTERNAGETVRFIDLPATLGSGQDIFDRKSEVRQQLSWQEWFKACEKNQGHVFEAFLRLLITEKPEIRKLIKDHVRNFASSVQDEMDGNLARDIAAKFGLVYAAGRIAIKFRLVPWTSVSLGEVIRKCYFAARDLLPDEGVMFRSGKSTLLSFLQKLPKSTEIDARENSHLVGFREARLRHYRCLVKRDKFNRIFQSEAQHKLVLNWLMADSRITLAATSTGPRKVKEQHFWPDGERYRSVEIMWPRVRDRS